VDQDWCSTLGSQLRETAHSRIAQLELLGSRVKFDAAMADVEASFRFSDRLVSLTRVDPQEGNQAPGAVSRFIEDSVIRFRVTARILIGHDRCARLVRVVELDQ
jgi:hypothetical protein